jgi:hypothetical protein
MHGRTQAQLVRKKEEHSQVREVRVEAGGEHDAPPQEGDAEEWKRTQGEEPQAGNRDRAFRGPLEGGKGPTQARREEIHPEEVERSQENGPEEKRPEVLVEQLTGMAA